MIEFGLAFPLLFVFLSGMFQFGYAFFIYNELQSTIRAGARYAATADFDGGAGADFTERVQNMVVYGRPTGGSIPLVKQLTTSNVGVTWATDGAGLPQTVTVRISSFPFYAVFKTITLTNKPRSTFIFLGQYMSP